MTIMNRMGFDPKKVQQQLQHLGLVPEGVETPSPDFDLVLRQFVSQQTLISESELSPDQISRSLTTPLCGTPPRLELASALAVGEPASANEEHLTYSVLNWWNGSTLERDMQKSIVKEAFKHWKNESGSRFEDAGEGNPQADIRISWERGDHGDGRSFTPGGDSIHLIAHAFYPLAAGAAAPGSPEAIYARSIHLNQDVLWYGNSSGNHPNLLSVLIHEIGHTLGHEHDPDRCAIMNAHFGLLC